MEEEMEVRLERVEDRGCDFERGSGSEGCVKEGGGTEGGLDGVEERVRDFKGRLAKRGWVAG